MGSRKCTRSTLFIYVSIGIPRPLRVHALNCNLEGSVVYLAVGAGLSLVGRILLLFELFLELLLPLPLHFLLPAAKSKRNTTMLQMSMRSIIVFALKYVFNF